MRIELEPYDGNEEGGVFALIERLPIRVYFDDVVCTSCRFCYKADEDTPTVDFDVSDEELERWFEGETKLVLESLPHDPERFAEDLAFWSEREQRWIEE